jgi:hypothetical protein
MPWIGPKWGDPANFLGGVKLLVLGDSTHASEYAVGTSPDTLTFDTVTQFLDKGEKWRVNRRRIGTPYRHPKGTPSFCVSND